MGNVHGIDRAPERLKRGAEVSFFLAAAVSLGLSLLFIVVYGGTNWVAAHQARAGTFFYAWELRVPFVSFFVIPYLSIDLFFVAAPLLCRRKNELRAFAMRVAAAIIIAGICFVAFPLRCVFAPPSGDSWSEKIFASFLALDAPYDLAPSLHAALGLILFDFYFRKSRGPVRGLVILWFLLIGLSPILTHQHHVIDIATGLALGGYCFFFVRDESWPVWRHTARSPIAFYYAAPAVILLSAAALDFRHFALGGWIGVSLALVAVAYFGLGGVIFEKRADGSLSWSTWFALGPCIFGQILSWLYYKWRGNTWSTVTPAVAIGPRPSRRAAAELRRSGFTAVLDLCAEMPETRLLRELRYRSLPLLDLTAPTIGELEQMAAFVTDESERGRVYVHCKIGYSRSSAAVAAYLIASGGTDTAADAMAMVSDARPGVVFRPETIAALEAFRKTEIGGAFVLASDLTEAT